MTVYVTRWDSPPLFNQIQSLSTQRLKRYYTITNQEKRNELVYGYLLLLYALKREGFSCEKPEFAFGPHGKPYFQSLKNVHFSLSHSHGAAACVISDREIGLDIQKETEYRPSLAKRICTANELEILNQLHSNDERSRFLTRMWCMKESVAKQSGEGISKRLNSIDTLTQGSIEVLPFQSYTIAVSYSYGDGTTKLEFVPQNLL